MNLANIINANVEILEHIYYEIKNSGFEKKLIGGIVVTGGSLLKHMNQLIELQQVWILGLVIQMST